MTHRRNNATEEAATIAARRVSRNGGEGRIILRDNITGIGCEIRTYVPYEAAMDGLMRTQ